MSGTIIKNGLNKDDIMSSIRIVSSDDRGPGNAPNNYTVSDFDSKDPSRVLSIDFQNGNPYVEGLNGIAMENLLAICADRLEEFEKGPYKNTFNRMAMTNIQRAIMDLNRRQAYYSHWPKWFANLSPAQEIRLRERLKPDTDFMTLALVLESACERIVTHSERTIPCGYVDEKYAGLNLNIILPHYIKQSDIFSSYVLKLTTTIEDRPNRPGIAPWISMQIGGNSGILIESYLEDFTKKIFEALIQEDY